MRLYTTHTGQFPVRLYYDDLREIDQLCLEALKDTDSLPRDPQPIRIDRFIEKYFKIAPRYESVAPGVLGYTIMGWDGVLDIVISQDLDEESQNDQVAERRVRTTLAHEGGHGLLHAPLFKHGNRANLSLFDEKPAERTEIACRDITGVQSSKCAQPTWIEFQANHAMGALLLPQPLVQIALKGFFIKHGTFGREVLDPACYDDARLRLSDLFNVNPKVADIRLKNLYPREKNSQLTLL